MKIIAKIKGENLELVQTLKQQGIAAKLVRGGVIVELPKREKKTWGEPDSFDIPEGVSDAILLIDCCEKGGGMTSTGSGTVICGLSGKPLKPYYVPRRGHLACGEHAYFSVPNAVITVTGYRRDSNITITKYEIKKDGQTAILEISEIWKGEIEFLPELYDCYKEAATAARQKANCYHCRSPHFIAKFEH